MHIKKIVAHEILASGGYPTVEVEVELESGAKGRASVPYGASAGSHEATVLNDGDNARYNGMGVLNAINNINNEIAPKLIGVSAFEQRSIDKIMIDLDGTPNKARLGGNAILAVSLAVAYAAANKKNVPLYKHIAETFQTGVDFSTLPSPMIVVIEGGKHADDTTDLQEYCITAIGSGTAKEKVRKAVESYHALKTILKENNLSTNVGNEGAFAPNGIPSNEAPFNFILQAIEKAGYKPGVDLGISIDAAASEFYKDGMYNLSVEKKSLTSTELIEYYKNWLEKYPVVTIEDMLDEDDWENWPIITKLAKEHNIENIGDDLTVTNIERLQKAIDLNAISSILIKLNQIGSLTETVDCCMLAKKHNMMTVTSHRGGGETNDTAMVDLAVAVGSRFIKVGPTRGERVSKYNRLMEIERDLK
ncbi:phosphopyruvate hydratase [Candidatus Woesebacteria bacterium]|nr:phosphopyruvate hydratase [Candidatus Woesebacteria bacterium]